MNGGNPAAEYKVIGLAFSNYEHCVSRRAKRAKGVGYFGPGLHTISFRKRIPSCVLPPDYPDYVDGDREWVRVRWKIKLKTEDGLTLLDRDSQGTRHTFCAHWAYTP
jgi:hypothetical protein